LLTLSPASAQQSAGTAQGSDTKNELAQNFAAEHQIGRRYHFDPNDLPPPKTGPIVADRSMIVPFNGQKLEVPPGFTAEPFVTGLGRSTGAPGGRSRAQRRLSFVLKAAIEAPSRLPPAGGTSRGRKATRSSSPLTEVGGAD
jgi:hypothetical protein